ncbi:MAG: hypothetical protein Kow0077_11310 [Anaerolineae bacterium]
MAWKDWKAGVLVSIAALLIAGCGGLSLDAAATAFAPTDPPPEGTLIRGTATLAVTPGADLGNALQRRGEEHRYTFVAEAGQAVTIDMQAPTGGGLDSYLELYGPDGALLVSNDDGGSGVDSRIYNYILPQSGEYTIVAAGFNRASTGSYTLRMGLGTPVPTPTPTPTPEPGGGPITIGEIRSGAINHGTQVDEWQFEAQAGEIVTIRMETTGVASPLDPFIELVGPNGNVLISDDDSGTGLDARIADYILPASGTYTIRASGRNGSRGIYNMVLRAGRPPTATLPPPTPGPSPTPVLAAIALGERVEAEYNPGVGGDTYFLTVDDPVVVEILLEAREPEFSLYLEMQEPNGTTQFLVDYGSAAPVTYLPGVFLRRTGEYTFRVRAVQSRFIDYTLLINPVDVTVSAGGPIAYGQSLSGMLAYPGQQDIWTFEGHEGDLVTIHMMGADMDAFLQLYDPDGVQIASNDDVPGSGALDARIQRVRLPRDGTYSIVASSFRSGSTGAYRVLLVREN